MSEQFLFGYGSLISPTSRQKSVEKIVSTVPVNFADLQRGWFLPLERYNYTTLGAIETDGAACNGVIVPVTSKDITDYDERELECGYRRIEFDGSRLTSLTEDISIDTGKTFWVYVIDSIQNPSLELPIPQSYIDVCMKGCLGFSFSMAEDFVNLTQGWDNPWINDREHGKKLYLRPEKVTTHEKGTIDGILLRLKPYEYSKRF